MKYIKIIPHFFFQLAMTLLWLITFLLVQKLDRTRLLSVDIYSTYLSNSDLWSLKMKRQNCWAHLLQIHVFSNADFKWTCLVKCSSAIAWEPNRWVDIFTMLCMKKLICVYSCVDPIWKFCRIPFPSSLLFSFDFSPLQTTKSNRKLVSIALEL